MEKITECPYCGCDEYYTRNVQRYCQYYNFNGEPTGAGEHQHVIGGKIKYCANCERRINTNDRKKANKANSKN